MKKGLVIVIAVLAVCMFGATVAMAAGYNAGPQVPTLGASSEWAHGNYSATNPDVCKDCHAVHNADNNSMFLLRNGGGSVTLVGQACMVCHGNTSTLTTANPYMYKGSRSLAGGVVVAYTDAEAVHYCDTAVDWSDSLDSTHTVNRALACADCHNVHGSDVTTAFNLEGAASGYPYRPIISNHIGPSSAMLNGNGTLTDAYASLCGICHNKNDQAGGGDTAAYTTNISHTSNMGRTTSAYNGSAVGGQITVGATIAGTNVTSCGSCHERMNISSNGTMSTGYRQSNRTSAYQLGGMFHGGIYNAAGATDDKLLSVSASPGVDENCLGCHAWGGQGVGSTF